MYGTYYSYRVYCNVSFIYFAQTIFRPMGKRCTSALCSNSSIHSFKIKYLLLHANIIRCMCTQNYPLYSSAAPKRRRHSIIYCRCKCNKNIILLWYLYSYFGLFVYTFHTPHASHAYTYVYMQNYSMFFPQKPFWYFLHVIKIIYKYLLHFKNTSAHFWIFNKHFWVIVFNALDTGISNKQQFHLKW